MFSVFRDIKPSVILRSLPPQEKFLDWRHYLRARLASKIMDSVGYSLSVEDGKYKYWIDVFNTFTVVTGTDDSGKLFCIVNRSSPNTENRIRFRRSVFGFDVHWHELDGVKELPVRVRLQGDLIATIDNIRYDELTESYVNVGVSKVALKFKDYKTAVMLDKFVSRVIEYYPDEDLLKKYFDEFLKDGTEYKVKIGRHRVKFVGFMIRPFRFAVAYGKLKVSHPEHGVNEINLGRHVVISFS